jgi:hypothetical protein
MPVLNCTSCGQRLKVPDDSIGRRFRCAKCGQHLQFRQEAAPDTAQPNPDSDLVPFATDPPQEQLTSEPRRPRKKKKKRLKSRSESGVPAWIGWWSALAIACIMTVIGFVSVAQAGYPKTAFLFAVELAFALPLSTVVFALSLFASNWLGAGVELAQFSSLIPKALLLILLANLLGLVPCAGRIMALCMWFIGAVVFFKLEVWESKVLVAINWALGWLMALVVMGALTDWAERRWDNKQQKDDQENVVPAEQDELGRFQPPRIAERLI